MVIQNVKGKYYEGKIRNYIYCIICIIQRPIIRRILHILRLIY